MLYSLLLSLVAVNKQHRHSHVGGSPAHTHSKYHKHPKVSTKSSPGLEHSVEGEENEEDEAFMSNSSSPEPGMAQVGHCSVFELCLTIYRKYLIVY